MKITRNRLIGAALAGLAVWAGSGFFTVQSDESAVRFWLGALSGRDLGPGVHYAAPWPLGKVTVAKTATSQTLTIGVREPVRPKEDGLWITGGASMVTARLTIQYSIASLTDHLLASQDPGAMMRGAAEQALNRFLAENSVDDILTGKRQLLSAQVLSQTQAALDVAQAGLILQSASVQTLSPPLIGRVSAAFQDVQSARADKERSIQYAHAHREQTLSQARAEAQKQTAQARAQAHGRIALARGEAAAFSALAQEYQTAPRSTRARLHLETITKILPASTLIIADPGPAGQVHLRLMK